MDNTNQQSTSQQPFIPKYLSISDLCDITRMSKSSVRREILPRLKRYEFGRRCARYRADEVTALLESMEAGAA